MTGFREGVLVQSETTGNPVFSDTMTATEAADYIISVDLSGVTLTPIGCGAARLILEYRQKWTPSHALMLNRIMRGGTTLPHKIRRLVNGTRLGLAIDLYAKSSRSHIRNQKRKARRRAARARYLKAQATANETATA